MVNHPPALLRTLSMDQKSELVDDSLAKVLSPVKVKKVKENFIRFKFRSYDFDNKGYLDRNKLAALLKDMGIADLFPPEKLGKFIDMQMENVDEDHDGRIGIKDFMHYYNDLVDYCRTRGLVAQEMDRAIKHAHEVAAAEAEQFDGEGARNMKLKYNVEELHFDQLNDAIERIHNKEKKTPVIIGPEHRLVRFFFDEDHGEYNDEIVPIDCKKMLYEIDVVGQDFNEVMDRARQQILLSLTGPATLALHCCNAAPDFKHHLHKENVFPKEVFMNHWLLSGMPQHYMALVRPEDKKEEGQFRTRPGSRVIVTSTLGLSEIEPLIESLPLPPSQFKFIYVNKH